MSSDEVQVHDLVLSTAETVETLGAIRAGRVDAVVIAGATGERVHTFRDPDHAYRALVEAMAEGAALVTGDGIICYHNPRLAELAAGTATRSLVGRRLDAFMTVDTAPSIAALLDRAQLGPARIEVAVARAGNHDLPIQLTASPVTLAQDHVVCVVASDLSEQRLQEELYREALVGLRGRERLISIAGHELRGPLQILMLRVEAMLSGHRRRDGETPSTAADRGQLEAILEQATAIAKSVNNLLDLGQIDSDQLTLTFDDLDLEDIVRDAANNTAELAQCGSTLALDVKPVRGRWDRIRIEQVVTNLISNAAKYGLGKPIRVTLDGDADRVRLTVRDHGVGLTPESIERLFQPYSRISGVKTAKGLGLGLYITQQIVHAHGGHIRVDSTAGEGSCFVVELPRVPTLAVPTPSAR